MEPDGDDAFHFPNRADSSAPSVPRRDLLAGSAVAASLSAAGCTSDSEAGSTQGDRDGAGGDAAGDDAVTAADSVFVFNTGDRTVSVVDVGSESVVGHADVGLTASFPANQYAPSLTEAASDPLWLNVDDGVRAVAVGSLSTVAAADTGSGANWQEVTPDGSALVVSAREPAHRQLRVDADPSSEGFGTVTAELDRTDEDGRGDATGPGPCDVTIHPDGRYAYVADLFGDTLTVLDVERFEIATQVGVEPVVGDAAAPWMGTVAPDGETLLVEHDEGETGTESLWDVRDPADPEERVRLSDADGLGERPLTSEIGPDSETGYVFTPGTEDVSVIDLAAGTVADRIDLGGEAFVGTWGPEHRRLFVPVQTADEVAVIDHERGRVTARLDVGSSPYGATAARVRPADAALSETVPASASLWQRLDRTGTSYCVGNCDCGHRL